MDKWEATVIIDDGSPTEYVMVFDVEADTDYCAKCAAHMSVEGPTPVGMGKKVKSIEVVKIPEGSRSRSGQMKHFIKNGWKDIPPSKKYMEEK